MSHTGSVNKQVLVALSGGMDSAYAAWALKSQGYEVLGVHFRLDPFTSVAAKSKDAIDIDHAPRTEAEQRLLDSGRSIAVEVVFAELGARFQELVLKPFIERYEQGCTPNPCVVCNAKVKFPVLHDLADRLGAAFYATGHYARIGRVDGLGHVVCRGSDADKDQSYFLCRVPSALLERCLMPLGEMTKGRVKAAVLELGILGPAVRPSQDLCFARSGYKSLFKRLAFSPKPGPIVDVELGLVGRHEGIMNFTIGQRRGLSIALSEPRYVLRIDPSTRTVFVGKKNLTYGMEFTATDVIWADRLGPRKPLSLFAKIRYKHKAQRALITPIEGRKSEVNVRFDRKQPSITPGQAVTFYDGDCVVGAGWIEQVPNLTM